MKFRVSWKFFSIIELMACRKVVRSMYQRKETLFALMEADLGEEYRSANSPKPSPA